MTEQKQIEEMALDIHSASSLPLELCGALATDLYTAGYRKQIAGEWTYSEDKKTMKCTRCRLRMKTYDVRRFCPNCGARMKGDEGK